MKNKKDFDDYQSMEPNEDIENEINSNNYMANDENIDYENEEDIEKDISNENNSEIEDIKTYQEIKVIYDSVLEREIQILLAKEEVHEFIISQNLKASWNSSKKHLNTGVWPGVDESISIIVEKKDCDNLIEKFKELRDSKDFDVTFKLIVYPIEMIV